MRLAHLHLPNITPFTRVSNIQETLTSRFLAHKKLTTAGTGPPPPPDPTIITFTPNPVYTTGRRDLPPSNTNNWDVYSASASVNNGGEALSLPPSLEPIRSILTPPSTCPKQQQQQPGTTATTTTTATATATSNGNNEPLKKAEYHPTLRGGQTTYHGPGQLVAYTILDLRRLGLTPRCHIQLLENSVVDVLAGYGLRGIVTEDPGVWVPSSSSSSSWSSGDQGGAGAGVEQSKKITAVGVHLRRNISSYGIGFNVTDEPMWFFRQIVACGLEGRETTSLQGQGVEGVSVGEVAERFVRAFTERVNRDFTCAEGQGGRGEGIEEVYRIEKEDLL